ncbi:MAG: restriction endonuclease subunit S [Leptolyngbyaceae cyanobacterium SU_3_3]|nr:restriction endonuclease subunit S [Leptolyngbyaceae cyanobacterium SU_3_3]
MEEVPYDLPKGWVWVRLGHISEYIQRGKSPIYSDIREIPIISQKCVQWSGFDKTAVKFIDPSTLNKYQDERFIQKGDLLWNSTGTGTLGRINIYKDELKVFKKVVADSHVTIVRPLEVCNEYVLNFLMSPIVQNHIEENASGTTNQIELNTTTVTIQVLPLPPLAEQRRIVAKIDQLMARCDQLEKLRSDRAQTLITVHTAALNRLLTAQDSHDFSTAWHFITQHFSELYSVKETVAELRKTILQLAVMGKLVPQDPNDEPASELLKAIEVEKQKLVKERKIKQSKPLPDIKPEEVPYELPKGWKWVRLGNVGAFERGRSKHRPRNDKRLFNDGSYPFVQTGDVSKSKFTNNIITSCSSYYNDFGLQQSRLWTKGTLCITIAANIAETGFLGIDACIPDSVVAFLSVDESLSKLVKVFIDVAKQDLEHYAPSTAQKNINLGIINDLIFPLPPLAEQRRIVAKIDQLMALCDRLENAIAAAQAKQTDLLNAVIAQV